MDKAEAAVDAGQGPGVRDRQAKKGEIDTTLSDVKAIIVGNDERLNWIRLNEVLVAALPRHGDESMGGNLTDPDAAASSGATKEGQRAYAKYQERMAAGIPLEKIADDDHVAVPGHRPARIGLRPLHRQPRQRS